uniref:ATP-binding protein n=1 Tax=Thermus caliditerrae TaxID=1330700 RepID=A0A7C5VEP3_9DEIN
MAVLKPWHLVAMPHEDLRKGIPLDASAFAIHLDQVVDGRAPGDYGDPQRFFARTYLTEAYRKMAAEVLRRLAGEPLGTSPGINLTTQFGGGKTHFLTLLYHLCRAGDAAQGWPGVSELLEAAGLSTVPQARVAVFIGNWFDFVVGVGAEGEPRRKTPWGDLAWQLGGNDLYQLVKDHDEQGVVPGGEVLQKIFTGEPTLILMDEVLSFLRRARGAGDPYRRLGSQFYSFLDVLTREVIGSANTALVVSLPFSEYEMTQEDEAEFQRLSKLLDRLSKAVLLSEKVEIAEIVRRRLFEDVGDPKEIARTAKAYAEWVRQHRGQLPEWFPVDQAEMIFKATYPFHPTVLSVFERKWQSLPRFQRTRGILRLLALWVSHAWQRAYREGTKEPLITLGSAPLEDLLFRAATFEQLGEGRLEAAVLSDIAGEEAHAVRLDQEAGSSVKRLRLHQQVATAVFFESSGGQVRNGATLPEVRLAVGGPEVEVGMIEDALERLVSRCYYLEARGMAYWISHRPTLNKLLSDRRAALSGPQAEEQIREKVRQAIREVFKGGGAGIERRYFPEDPMDIPDVAALRLVVMAPEHGWENVERERTKNLVRRMVQEYGGRGRTYKSGLIFVVAEGGLQLSDEARTLLALESLEDPAEQERLRLEPAQVQELREKKRHSEKKLGDLVWHVYRRVLLLGKDNELQEVDLGQLHPSMGKSLVDIILMRLKQEGILEETISPDFLVRHWPPAHREGWSTRAVREVFYASPLYPRLLNPDALRETIARGVREGKFAYVVRSEEGRSRPIFQDAAFTADQVEFSEEVLLMLPEQLSAPSAPSLERPEGKVEKQPSSVPLTETPPIAPAGTQPVVLPEMPVRRIAWEGSLPPQQWTNFYMKILTHFATDPSLRIFLRFEAAPERGISREKEEEIRSALRELGLDVSSLEVELVNIDKS